MLACYIDEAGNEAVLPTAASPIQPVLAIVGLCVDLSNLKQLTEEFLGLKVRFYPHKYSGLTRLDCILHEVKGADIRETFRIKNVHNHNARHRDMGFLDEVVKLIEKLDCRILARIWVKPIGGVFEGRSVFTYSAQRICAAFENLLAARDEVGVVVPDPRSRVLNSRVSHSIFTQKFKRAGDAFPHIAEMPLFGQSSNHAAVQIADLLASAIVFPVAAYVYCTGHVANVHVDAGFSVLKTRFGKRLKELQHRYQDGPGYWRGGITVCDRLGFQDASAMFR